MIRVERLPKISAEALEHGTKRRIMLKITRVAQSNQKITLQLDGRVADQWIDLLLQSAESILNEGFLLTLDLKNICFIDCAGLTLIKSLMKRGVRQVNAPLFVTEQLRRCERAEDDTIEM